MPESDPGDGDYNDADEFLQDLANVDHDETLIGLVGEGYDVNAPGDQAVADLLGAWRDDVGRTPVGPIAERAQEIHTLNQQFNGGSEVSINENAAHVAQLAENTTAQGILQTSRSDLEHVLQMIAGLDEAVVIRSAQAGELLGGQEGQSIAGQGMQALEGVSELMGVVSNAIVKVDDLTALVNALNTAMRDAAQRHLG